MMGRRWLAALLVLGLMGGIAFADGTDYPAVVVNNSHRDDLLPLYTRRSYNAPTLGEHPNGTTAWLLADEGGWSLVRLGDGTEGYFLSERLVNMEGLTGLVPLERARQRGYSSETDDPSALLMYDYPLADAPTSTVPPAQKTNMTILRPFGTWIHVRLADGREGYIPSKDLDCMTSLSLEGLDQMYPHTYVVRIGMVANIDPHDRLDLRQEPSIDSASLGRYFNGTQIGVLASNYAGLSKAGWEHVVIDGKVGYVMERYTQSIYLKAPSWGQG
ncbi:MAG: SH3 domain-containing protein [Oscillospiraceae bacterium]|jgi:hypothetical protein|nr:SH3 domain-containing protein [Oscillospiraceae bacterium]